MLFLAVALSTNLLLLAGVLVCCYVVNYTNSLLLVYQLIVVNILTHC